MTDSHTRHPTPKDTIGGAMSRLIADVIRRRRAGEAIGDSEIEVQHPELMPRLREELRTLRQIEHAAEQARRPDDRSPPSEGEELSEGREALEYLRNHIHGYTFLESVSYGGQGIVYKAVQRATNRTVAVKVLLEGPLATGRKRQRFAREIDLISRLKHPNIVTLYESGAVGGRLYFTMEFIEGLSIDDYVLLERPSVREIARLFTVVCRAVNYAHQRGIIHRDLKPSNILVDDDGQPHILDFGLAKELTESEFDSDVSALSLPGQIVGTTPYLSPEQVGGDDGEVDIRTDVYALGVVLFQTLTRSFPYPVDGPIADVRKNILTREPIGVRKALTVAAPEQHLSAADLDDDLDAIILTALRKAKSRRYQSAAGFADDLDRYLAGEAVGAKANSRLYLFRKTLRRYRVQASVAAAFVLLLLGSLVGMTVLWRKAERVARIAQAGLQMGSHLRLGSVARDEKRLDQAAIMFEKALEIGETVPNPDRLTQRFQYDAHHRLAELYYNMDERIDAADRHCDAAVAIAEHRSRLDPADLEWRRLLAFSYLLRGRMAFSHERWRDSQTAYARAASIFEELQTRDPGNPSHQESQAFARGYQAWCFQRLEQWDEALRLFTQAHALYASLLASDPDSLDYAIELSQTEVRLASWHLLQRTEDHDRFGGQWLRRAEDCLNQSSRSKRADDRRRDFDNLMSVIRKNKALIDRRAKARSNQPR